MKYLYLAQLEAVFDADGAAPAPDCFPALLVTDSAQEARQQARARCAGWFSELRGWSQHAVRVTRVAEETLLEAGYRRISKERGV